jgi:hypothetical protein
VLRYTTLCLFVIGLFAGCSTPSAGGNAADESSPATSDTKEPAVDPTAIVDIAAGGNHTCAVLGSGHVACWGTNDDWQLGDGTQEPTETPVLVHGLSDAVELTAGAAHTCALRSNGTVWCWGNTENGRLGNGSLRHREAGQKFPALVRAVSAGESACHQRGALEGVQSIAAGSAFTCGLLESGSVVCWGALESTEWATGKDSAACPVPIFDLDDAKQLAAGPSHACALRENGEVACFGGSFVFASKMGIKPTTSDRDHRYAKPGTVEGLPEATFVAAGRTQTCAVTADEQVFCWGKNESPVLVEGGPKDFAEPVEIPELAGAKELAVKGGRICGWGGSFGGTIRCLGETAEPRIRETVLGAEPTQVSFGWKFGCARMGDVDILCWDEPSGDEDEKEANAQPDSPEKFALDAPALVKEARARPPFERPQISVDEIGVADCTIDTTLGEGTSSLHFKHDGRTLGINFDGVTTFYDTDANELRVHFPPVFVSESPLDKSPRRIAPYFHVEDFTGAAGTYAVTQNPRDVPDHLGCFPLTWYVPGELEVSSYDHATGKLEATFHFGPRSGPFGTLSGTLSTQKTPQIELASRDASNQVSLHGEDLPASAVDYDLARRRLRVYQPGRRSKSAVAVSYSDAPSKAGKYLVTRHFGEVFVRDLDQGLPLEVSRSVTFYDIERFDAERITAEIWRIDEDDLPQPYDPESLSFFGDLSLSPTESHIREHGKLMAKIDTDAVYFSPGKRQELSLEPPSAEVSSARAQPLVDAISDAALEPGTHRRLFYAGKKVDEFLKEQGLPVAKWEWKTTPETVDGTDTLRVEANFPRQPTIHLRKDTLAPVRWQTSKRIYYDDKFGGPQDTELTVTFGGDKLEMHAKNAAQGEHKASYPLPENVYFEHQLFWLIPRLKLQAGDAYTLKLFRIEDEDVSMKSTAQMIVIRPDTPQKARKEVREKFEPVMKRYLYRPKFVGASLRVLAEETVELGERSVEVYRLELAGDDRPRRTFLVQKEAPHRVLIEEPSPDQMPGFALRNTVLVDPAWAPKYSDKGSAKLDFSAENLKATIAGESVAVEPGYLQGLLESMRNREMKEFAKHLTYPYLLPDSCRFVPDQKTFIGKHDKPSSKRRRERGPSPFFAHLIGTKFVTDVDAIDEGARRAIKLWEELPTKCELDSSTKQALAKRAPVYLTLDVMMDGDRDKFIMQLIEVDGAWKVSGMSTYR